MTGKPFAIAPTRAESFPDWYQSVIREADMAENSVVRGCMVIKPWGYGLWENIQRGLDDLFKATGHENAYFPLFIPQRLLEREAEHVDGFAKEMAVVTHHRLEQGPDGLRPAGELNEPLIVRPTSETIIGESFSRWINSYRDLPLLLNQWANVVRWEMRPRLFLRTTEFLWQEGHTAHASPEEAWEETRTMLGVYAQFAREHLAMPVLKGEKPEHERFPGAVRTLSIEAMMQDGKALQAGTSHYLGENFAKAANIMFVDRDGERKWVHTTSWGSSTRLIGGLIMTHGDDNGLRLPPMVAPSQIVILPVTRGGDEQVSAYCDDLARRLRLQTFGGRNLRCKVDHRDLGPGRKKWEWIKRGVPLILEVGQRDIANKSLEVTRRTSLDEGKVATDEDRFLQHVERELQAIQDGLLDQATAFRDAATRSDLDDAAALREHFSADGGGFAICGWSRDTSTLAVLQELGASIRCILPESENTERPCAISGQAASCEVVIAKAY